MLIEGSSRSSGALVGEHQPDELMRDGGRWAGRPLAVMSEMKVSQEDVHTRAWAWRGVAARTASRFMMNRALSRGAKTNGAVYAAPGGSRHRLYHWTAQTRGTSCARRRRWSGPPCARWRARLRWRFTRGGVYTKRNRLVPETAR
eukprot:COSAG06_NODE_3933_length_4750_cov_3.537734_1_plen_145_part_00